MFAAAYFAPREFAPRYFPKAGAALPVTVAVTGGAADEARRKYLAWKRRRKKPVVTVRPVTVTDSLPISPSVELPRRRESELLTQAIYQVVASPPQEDIAPAIEAAFNRLREQAILSMLEEEEEFFMLMQ